MMKRNIQKTESSLLLQLPSSVYTYNGSSDGSFLMPVAVENVIGVESSSSNISDFKKHEDNLISTEPISVCQLQQPLMMTNKLPGERKHSVPNLNTCTELCRSSHEALVYSQTSDSQTNLASSVLECPKQLNAEYSNYQNQQLIPPPPHSQSYYSESTFVPNCTNINPTVTSSSSGICDRNDEYYYQNAPALGFSLQSSVRMPSTVCNNQTTYERCHDSSNPNFSTDYSYSTPVMELHSTIYEPVNSYWLFKDIVESKEIWYGFSKVDSDKLERIFQQDHEDIVPVHGGRYDVKLSERIKKPVYFEGKDIEIRRCTWFYRPDSPQCFVPFSEEAATLLEQHYCSCVTSGQWQKRVHLSGVGSVAMENPFLLLYYRNEVDLWPPVPDSKANPRTVKRGLPENIEILSDESNSIDHLVFIVQGIGSFCDLKLRTVSECVDGFRDIANNLLISHFKDEIDSGQVGRVEFLPLAWHAKLHTSDKGFDRCMWNITLPSIPKLRHFTNDTLLDILLYSSPSYCQCIIDTVASELNKLHEIFLKRNPEFSGKVFVAGHSLGSLILFDILANQQTENKSCDFNEFDKDDITLSSTLNESGDVSRDTKTISIESILQSCNLEEYVTLFRNEKIDLLSLINMTVTDMKNLGLSDNNSKLLSYAVTKHCSSLKGMNETSQPSVQSSILNHEFESWNSSAGANCLTYPVKCSPCMSLLIYPRLKFEPAGFFALGSPISMFLAVRGYDTISDTFKFPTCPAFFHIFHPYDPVAYRIEPLINPNFSEKPVLIPHHKGRKRMHLEIRENISKVGLEIKQKLLETLKYTWNSLSGFAKSQTFLTAAVEAEVDQLVNKQMSESEFEIQAASESSAEEIQIGSLNGGRRIDYVLQEKPIEALNDYIFALTSHGTYWDSEDTVLMILKEIYAMQGIFISSNKNKQFSSSNNLNSSSCTQLNTAVSNSSLYQNSGIERIAHGNILSYNTNQSLPSTAPVNIQCMNDDASVFPDISTSVPPTHTFQPVGPPPLSGFVKKSPFSK